jgi:SAM-dependent methyltransferase
VTTPRIGPPRPDQFDDMYTTTPPWEIGRPQPSLRALAEAGAWRGHVLDVGCGTGEHALLAASLGLPATGIDLAPRAIALAEAKAQTRGLTARFVAGSALDLAALGATYDTVVDSALFHVLDDADRARFVASVATVVAPGSRYFLLCFSEHQPGTWGPRRVTQAELRASFADGWRVDALEATRLELSVAPPDADGSRSAAGWIASLTRVA